MRKILFILFVTLFYGSFNVQAQSSGVKDLPSFNDPIYNDYINKKELWVCTSVSRPVLLSIDVFGVSFTIYNGKFSKVTPGKPEEIIEDDLGGLFNVAGMPSGVYEFTFRPTAEICQMDIDQVAVVRVYLVPDLTPYNILRNICSGDRVSINLLDFMPQEVRAFTKELGWNFHFYDTEGNLLVDRQGNPTSTLENMSKEDLGTRTYSYTIDDSQGFFAGKYSAMEDRFSCAKKENIGLTIKVKGADIKIQDKEVSYCFENVIETTVNYPSFNINLKSLTEAEAPTDEDDDTQGWTWTNQSANPAIVEFKHLVTANSAEDFRNGEIQINTKLMDSLITKNVLTLPVSFEFKYKYVGCYGDEFETKLVVEFTDKLRDIIINKSKSICRNLNASSVNIATYFGFDIPVTAANWSELINGAFVYKPTGIVNIDDLKLGTEYTYKCHVSNIAESLCDAAGVEATFNLKVRDIEMQSAIATICKTSFDDGVEVNLFDYVMGLSNENVIDPSTDIKWCIYGTDPADCTEILDPKQYTIEAFEGVIPTFKFEYNTDCGVSEGKLYVSVVDEITVKEHHKEITVCFTDDYASSINLFEVLGIMGLDGEFTSTTVVKDGVIFDGRIFNATEAFVPDPSNSAHKKVYVFEYDTQDEDCLSEKATVTVTVTQTKQDIIQ